MDSETEFFVPLQGLKLDHYLENIPGETSSPKEKRLHKQAVHHLARYNWAVQVLQQFSGERVLDVACGAGYGTYLLAQALPEIQFVGGDYDHRAVQHASENYGALPNLTYQALDMVSWESLDGTALGTFDRIVSFDTLEHLSFREIALINIAERLTDDGILLLSTPCGHANNKLNPDWEHHKIEYSHIYLVNLMKRFFSDVRTPEKNDLPLIEFWRSVVNRSHPLYLNKANPLFCRNPIKYGL